jgi:hypothetical protein
VKRFTHDADLRGMVVIRTLGFQLVPFNLHRFRKQRRIAGKTRVKNPVEMRVKTPEQILLVVLAEDPTLMLINKSRSKLGNTQHGGTCCC